MAQYIWHELAASGLFIYIQRKLGVRENSAIWQKLNQPRAVVGRCWHPKESVPRSNSSGLSCKGWAGQSSSFHLCESPGAEQGHRALQAPQCSPLAIRWVLTTAGKLFLRRSRLLVSVPVTITPGCLHRRGEFIPSQINSVFTSSPKQSYWKENMLNELYSRQLQNAIYVFKDQGWENRQD